MRSSEGKESTLAEDDLSWTRRAMRWGQINIREIEPPEFDVAWWEAYWRSIHLDGITLLGPLPAGIQATTTFSGAVCTTSGRAQETLEWLAFLTSTETTACKQRHGMSP